MHPKTSSAARTTKPSDRRSREPTIGGRARFPITRSLDGLEERWATRWDAGHVPLRRSTAARRGLLDRHAAADGVGGAARRARLLLHPDRLRRPLPAHARQGRLLPDRLGRQRPADRAPGPELLRRPLRPVRPLRPRVRPAGETPEARRSSISRPNFVELCHKLTAEDEQAFEALFRRIGLSRSTGRTSTRRSVALAQRTSQRAFLRMRRPPATPTARRRRRCGTSTSRRRSPRPSSRTGRSPANYHRVRFRRPRPARRSRSRRPGPSSSRPASHSSPTPTTPATRRCSARPQSRRCSGSRSRSAAHPLADPEKGSGIAMVCTFGDLTDVTWWRDLGLATRTIVRRDGRLGRAPFGSPGWESPRRRPRRAGVRRARGADRPPGPDAGSSSCSRPRATSSASRGASRTPSTSTRRASGPLEIVSSPPVVRPDARAPRSG